MSTKRRTYSAEFKAMVALEALKEQETLNQIANRHGVLPVQVSQWKTQLAQSLPEAFARGKKATAREQDFDAERNQLYRKIGQLEVERDWLKKKSAQLGLPTKAPFHD
jgi:transposase